MRVLVIFKERTDYARQVNDYIVDFRRQTGRDLEIMDPETRDGVGFCQTYDLLQFPTIVALSDDGQLQHKWVGLPLPTINEVSYYV